MRMTPGEMRKVLELCQYPGYTFHLTEVMYDSPYLVCTYDEPNAETGKTEERVTRRWLLTLDTTPSELVETAFRCVLTATERRVKETFTYRGRTVMCLSHEVEMLVAVCDRAAELRKQQQKARTRG